MRQSACRIGKPNNSGIITQKAVLNADRREKAALRGLHIQLRAWLENTEGTSYRQERTAKMRI